MNNVWHIIRLAFAVCFGVAAAVCVFVNPGLVVPLGIVSIAFSQMPE